MARRVWENIARKYPDYAELHDILSLAAETWPRFGISAVDLVGLDEMSLEWIRLVLAE
jgi:hypothetical protein